MDTLNVGVVGCGVISGIYFQNVRGYRGLTLKACADVRPEAAQAQASRHGIEARTVDELLASKDIDLIVNLTVPGAHFGVSLAALRAGKHVFSEKPLAVDFEQGRTLVAEAEARGVLLGCAPDTFLGAGGRLARKLVDEGAVGRILSGTAFLMSHGMEHWHPDPEFFFKPGGGPILDMAPYYLSALINLIGPVNRVMAMASVGFAERIVTAESPRKGHRIAVETPTHVMALLEFASGAKVTFCMSWDVWKHGHPAIELYGTDGSLRVPDPNFFGGDVEITERNGDWKRARFRRDAARHAELALAELGAGGAGPRQLPCARPRRSRRCGTQRRAAPLDRTARAARARGHALHPRRRGGRAPACRHDDARASGRVRGGCRRRPLERPAANGLGGVGSRAPAPDRAGRSFPVNPKKGASRLSPLAGRGPPKAASLRSRRG